MTSNEILNADVLDILFDNRNKQYGAYALRKNYNSRLGMALAISLSAILLFFFVMRISRPTRAAMRPDNPELLIETIKIQKEKNIVIPPVKKLPVQEFRQKQFTRLLIVDKKIIDPPPDIRELDTYLISNKNVDGPMLNGTPTVLNNPPAVLEKKEEKPIVNEAPIQREPEFPGGQEAWINFLRKNLISPEEMEAGDRKMVSIRFQVSAEGIVTNFEVVQSAGKVFDNEVIRVLKKMPKWKPAIQNGLPVARAFTQPVTFVSAEQ